MANRVRGEVAVEIGDQAYTLLYSANALVELEGVLDKPVNAILAMLNDKDTLRIKTIRAVVWAGFLENHPAMTQEEAGRLITEIGFTAMMAKVGEALAAAFPEADPARPQ